MKPLPLILLLAGCVHYPSIDRDGGCEAYGVVETGQPMGSIVRRHELSAERLHAACDVVLEPVGRAFAGCAITQGDTVHLYYQRGDKCARLHEECHARNGIGHTRAYKHDVWIGYPMPYCPRNMLED